MKVKCKNCLPKEGLEIPDFSENDKQKIKKWKETSTIFATKKLIDEYKLSLGDSKYIILHVNTTYGMCNRCNFDNLNQEYIKCNKCGALNFNWKIE